GWTEVHTPLYTTLLWAWQLVGGSGTAWTRLLSVLTGLATIVVAELCLRRTSVSVLGRRLAVALTAAGGFGIVYAQEVRPYALLLLGATGLTAATLTRLDDLRDQVPTSWRRPAPWFGWALLTATTHLLGTVLVAVVTLVLAANARRRGGARPALRELGFGLVALLPQLAWIALGSLRSGFAQGTTWIVAPTPASVWELLTTSFGAGGLTPHSDGFPFTSPAGVAVVLVVLTAAVVLRARGRRPPSPDDPETGAAQTDLRSGLLLLAIAAATILLTYLVSQWVHLWTLRNMIVVLPPLTWGVAWVAAALPRTPAGRRGVAATLLVAMLVSLGPVARDLQQPYKNDWRSLIRYLEQVRNEDPEATFSVFGSDPAGAIVAADGDTSAAARQRLDARMDWHPRDVASIADLRRIPGRQVVYYHGGVGRPRLPEVERAILEQLDDPRCRPVPIYGFVVVSCP
ncbi:MAG TPA: hypothetical protein VEV65_12165, partial [Kineosporiaceae bacterium]|nr:hypothetical protein [Kineosporiaceae bacterium]